MFRIILAFGLVGLTWLTPSCPAQPEAGDLMIACLAPGNGLYRVTREGQVDTLLDASFNFPNAITMWADNTDLAVALADPSTSYVQNHLLRMGPDGLTQTLASIQPGAPNAIDFSEDGNLLVFTASSNTVLKLSPAGRFLASVVTIPSGALNAGCLDITDGGLWLGAYWQLPQGGLLKSDLQGTVHTVAWGLGRISWIAADPFHGGVVATRFDSPEVLRVDAGGSVTSLAIFQGANAATVDPDGSLWLAAGTILLHATIDGVPIKSYALPGNATALEVYGRRVLSGSGDTGAGSTYTLSIHSHHLVDSNQPYCLAASTAPGPALTLPDGRRLTVGPSPLLALSLRELVPGFRNFQGRLDPFGRALATLEVPAGLAGLRLYLTGVTVDEGAGRISTVMNTVGVTLR